MRSETGKAYLRGITGSYTMVFFSRSLAFGLILLAVSFFDLYAGIAGLISVLIANLAAAALGLNREKIASGMYGFNALLIGLGLGIAIQPSVSFYVLLVFIAISALLITLAMEGVLAKYGLPYLSLPFLITIWISVAATRGYTSLEPGQSGIFMLNTLYIRGGQSFVDLYIWFDNLDWPLVVKTYFKSLGAILFQYHLLAGVLMAAGILIWSRIAFLYSLLGFAAAWFFYMVAGGDIHELDYAFIGFNHILAAIAIGSFFTVPSIWSVLWVLFLTPLVSMLISAGNQILSVWQLPLFSLPFNVVVILFLFGLRFRERMLKKPELVVIQKFSPELNLYAASTGNRRFPGKGYLPLSLPFYGFRHINQAYDGNMTHQGRWRHAWDFVIRDAKGREFANNGTSLNDYYCFNKPVLAPADGWISEAVSHIEDNEPGKTNLTQNWGNTIVIKHTEQLYTLLSHLRRDSILYPAGTFVHKGQVIAQCGNSGRSPFPHLHFQVQIAPRIGADTISYPLAHYIRSSETPELYVNSIPQLDDEVSNIIPDPSLQKAFLLEPGNIIRYKIDDYKAGEWHIRADLYGNTYLYCPETDSSAGFTTDGHMFHFTWFKGKRKSMLFYFYLSAYQIPLGYYEGLHIDDVFPPTILRYSLLRLVNDITAPFFQFLRPGYRMIFVDKTDDIAGNSILISSSVVCKLLKINLLQLDSEIHIDATGLKMINFKSRGKQINLTFGQ